MILYSRGYFFHWDNPKGNHVFDLQLCCNSRVRNVFDFLFESLGWNQTFLLFLPGLEIFLEIYDCVIFFLHYKMDMNIFRMILKLPAPCWSPWIVKANRLWNHSNFMHEYPYLVCVLLSNDIFQENISKFFEVFDTARI